MKNGFLASTNKTNQPTNQRFASAETHSFLSFFLAFDRSVAKKNRHLEKTGREGKGREGKGREGGREEKKEGEQEQEFFGLGIRFCEFSGFVGEGVDVAAVLLTVVVCG